MKNIIAFEKHIELDFRKPSSKDIDEITAFKQEFIEYNSGMDGTGVLNECDAEERLLTSKVMETTQNPLYYRYLQYGLFDNSRLLGLIQIRLDLRGYLTEFGGHIGYCVRPSERRKGYPKLMLQNALEICRQVGLTEILLTCLEDNIASAKVIEYCGGIFERTTFDESNNNATLKRYWIELV